MAQRKNVLMINVDEWPVCIPARRTLMTGLSPRTHGDRVYSDRMPMPQAPTLPGVFRDNGYQTIAVGKLHVYPQRDRIGFDDAVLTEEGRYEFGTVDDYQIWLGENGYTGQEFLHSMGNNTEGSARVPFFITGKPVAALRGARSKKLAQLGDIMPTLLTLCGLPVPKGVEGIDLLSGAEHPYLYGEVSDGDKATRMIRWQDYKLIYYPCGNVCQLFDLARDPGERHDCAGGEDCQDVLKTMQGYLMERLYCPDTAWIKAGRLVGTEAVYTEKADYGLYNQRDYHWPPPTGYSNLGKNV